MISTATHKEMFSDPKMKLIACTASENQNKNVQLKELRKQFKLIKLQGELNQNHSLLISLLILSIRLKNTYLQDHLHMKFQKHKEKFNLVLRLFGVSVDAIDDIIINIFDKFLIISYQLSSLAFSRILVSKYLASTTMDPSEVQISSRMVLLTGSLVIWKMASSLKEFLLYFSRK